ncbi:hypothetical protein Tco_0567313 [Tanacetum coccineum]
MPSTKLHLSKAKRHQRIVIGQDSNKNDTRDYEQTHLDGKFYTKSKPKEAQGLLHKGKPLWQSVDQTSLNPTMKAGYPMISEIKGQRSNPRGACEEVPEASLLAYKKEPFTHK